MLTVFVSDVVVTAVILNTTFIRALTSLARANTAVQCRLPCPCVLKLPAQIGLTIRTTEWFKHNNVVRNWLTNAAYISQVRIDLEVVTLPAQYEA